MSLIVDHGERGAIVAAVMLLKMHRSCSNCATSPDDDPHTGIVGCGLYCADSAAITARHR